MEVDRLTELANKVIAVTDTEKRYKAVSNLQETILKDTGSLINDCKKVIDNETTLRFSDFKNEIYRMWGIYNVPYKCIFLLTNNLNDVIEYENDTEEKRAERKQKLKDFAQVVGIQLPPKKVIHHMGAKCYTEVIRDVSPDIIYCQHGTYRQYDELHNTFYFILCRKIQQSEAKGGLKELFQKVCLYIALNNEKAMMVDELLLLGVDIEQKNSSQGDIETTYENNLPSEQSKATKRGRQSKTFKDCLRQNGKLQTLHAIMNGKKGKEAALVMKVAVQIGWITKPTFKAVQDEFGDIGNRSNYNKYINENSRFTNDEIDGMKQTLLSS